MRDFYKQREVTAKKAWRCEEAGPHSCRRTAEIQPGSRYVRCFGVTDGRAWTVRLCLRCARVYKKAHRLYYWDGDNGEGPTFGSLRDYIWERRR